MNKDKIGALLRRLRQDAGLTQVALAARLHVSDKAISKWERGAGLPDIGLLSALSTVLAVDVEGLLSGELHEKNKDGGNMKKLSFYVCPHCGNTLSAMAGGELSCCGRPLEALSPQVPDEAHALKVETIELDYYITFSHPMQKAHHLGFVAWADDHRLLLVKLYAEQGGELRFPKIGGGALYHYCTEHGLFRQKL